MKINEVLSETEKVADEYGLAVEIIDRTEQTMHIKLEIDKQLFVYIYANEIKQKVNIAFILEGRRLYGYDSEGGIYHCHPFDNPDNHMPVKDRKEIREFIIEAINWAEENELL